MGSAIGGRGERELGHAALSASSSARCRGVGVSPPDGIWIWMDVDMVWQWVSMHAGLRKSACPAAYARCTGRSGGARGCDHEVDDRGSAAPWREQGWARRGQTRWAWFCPSSRKFRWRPRAPGLPTPPPLMSTGTSDSTHAPPKQASAPTEVIPPFLPASQSI
jgi:hypothetical protein